MTCPRCQQENPPQAKFCQECGTPTRGAAGHARAYVDLKDDNDRLRLSLSEALEQQTATSDILRVIAFSPTDLQSVLDAVAESAARLCEATDVLIHRVDGQMLPIVASVGSFAATYSAEEKFPITRGSVVGRAVMERRTIHIHDLAAESHEEFPVAMEFQRRHGHRTVLTTPLMRAGTPLGAIWMRRTEVRPFTDKQIKLLETFADQAAIAIENVRLFNETKEALDRQTATAEILRVIASSPTDLQPVLDAMAENAARLCESFDSAIWRRASDRLLLVAHHGPISLGSIGEYSVPLGRESVNGRAVLDGRTIHIGDVQTEADQFQQARESARRWGYRTTLSVPLMREGVAIGTISLRRTETRLFTERQVGLLRTFADQAVIAIENVRLFTELQEKNTALTRAHAQVSESLEQQTATSEILRVISTSPTEVQPVFDAIVRSAVPLCAGMVGAVFRFDGELMHLAAAHNYTQGALQALRDLLPLRPQEDSALTAARAILARAVIHVPDVQADSGYANYVAQTGGFRGLLAVPMLREGNPIGAIFVGRQQAGPFSKAQIALLQTFADQAVIAIENVRLFTETKEALEQQTATADILRVMSSSPTDVQPVFDELSSHAARLCEANDAVIFRLDGEVLRIASSFGGEVPLSREAREQGVPLSRGTVTGRAVIERRAVNVPDLLTELDTEYPQWRLFQKATGMRSVLAVPLMREEVAAGAILVRRLEVRPFTSTHIALLQTFADQAVIAIENVRLFKELQTSNRELTTALEQQTATSEILRVISRSQTDVQPVFDTIVASAVRLLEADSGLLTRIAGDQIEIAALTSTDPAGDAILKAAYPLSRHSDRVHAQVIRDRAPLNVADAQTDPRLPDVQHATARARGYRSQVAVPLLRHDEALGAIAVTRHAPGGFTDDEIALLQIFADQAVIAIENARLLSELQARTQELTRSVDELTALGDVSRALSSTLDLETVLNTIVRRANQLAGTAGCTIWEYDSVREEFRLRVSHYADDRDTAILQAPDRVTTIPKGQGVTSRVLDSRQAVQIADIIAQGAYESPIRRALLEAGHRALLGVPLLSDDEVIGVLAVTRKMPGEFASEIVQLLSTFATQSSLAVQNARLFHKLEVKSRELEVASQHKSEFLANMSHELRTPLNAIIGFSEVLGERMFGELNEKQEEYLKDIYASGTHLLSLINDILDLSKIEAGRMELELSDFHLPTALDNALTLVRERAGRRGIALQLNVDDRLGQIQADERKVRQVVLNLLSNAIKFTPEGGRIEVRAEPRDGSVEVSVSDTGIGIAPEDQEKVFEEFRQVGTADKKAEGTGLGLTLCRKFVELHGGRIWAKSQLGTGSTFTFTIPATE